MSELLRALASHVAVALECALARDRAEHYQRDLAKERDRLRLLLEINNHVVSQLEIEDVFRAASASIRSYFANEFTGIWLIDREGNQLQNVLLDFPTGRGLLDDAAPTHLTDDDVDRMRRREPGTWSFADIEKLPAPIAEKLRAALIGMRVLQFAFDGRADNPYLPDNYVGNSVTGTHDNNTTRGWFEELPDEAQQRVWAYLKRRASDGREVAPALLELAWSSAAALAMTPLQDLLNLGSIARMNVPGRADGNWRWRCTEDMPSAPAFEQLRNLTKMSNRWRLTPQKRPFNERADPSLPRTQGGRTMTLFEQQLQKMRTQPGFIAALDQSGGSTPKALRSYGIKEDAWSNEAEMFAIVHRMRTRIITSPSFTGERILGAILFENTMDQEIQGQPSADYLWNVKRVVPFLKVDQGLAEEKNGAHLMKPMPGLPALLQKAKANRIFGTKMRSVINQANAAGITEVVNQQFEAARQIIAAGFVPIIEPEVDIHCPEKAKAEALLKTALLEKLNGLPAEQLVMLKITLPEQDDFYAECVSHPNVVKVVALSGGYTREECINRLRRNHGVVASFSRALVEGLSAQQSDAAYNALLDAFIQSIFEASNT
jgi:fructose-bisphosphate aldolase class I